MVDDDGGALVGQTGCVGRQTSSQLSRYCRRRRRRRWQLRSIARRTAGAFRRCQSNRQALPLLQTWFWSGLIWSAAGVKCRILSCARRTAGASRCQSCRQALGRDVFVRLSAAVVEEPIPSR